MSFYLVWKILAVLAICHDNAVLGQMPDFWNAQARASIDQALGLNPNVGKAKNVVVFVGDGMDVSTIMASRIRQGQLNGVDGVSNVLAWEDFPYSGLAKTYSTDGQIPDSASTATAMFNGVKTKNGVLGLADGATRGDCNSATGNEVVSNLRLAHDAGKATGFVTTDRVTGASTAALYAHSPERNWENDGDIPRLQNDCTDLAYQLVMDNDFINVILGGGRRNFLPDTLEDPEYYDVMGRRQDGNDLIGQWVSGKPVLTSRYVWSQGEFDTVDTATTEFLLGLFEPSTMQFAAERQADGAGEPSLADMTRKAIEILRKDEDGFFLVVESALIDHGHHSNRAYDVLSETLELADAVTVATELTNQDDTLIIVTSDHAHTMAVQGYPSRNNPILATIDEENEKSLDGLPYTTLMYVNGPGGLEVEASWAQNNMRRDYTNADTESRAWVQDAIVPLHSETHGGTDVPVYAQGPWAHLFMGVHEQNYIAHAVRYAACLEPGQANSCEGAARMGPDTAGLREKRARPAYAPKSL